MKILKRNKTATNPRKANGWGAAAPVYLSVQAISPHQSDILRKNLKMIKIFIKLLHIRKSYSFSI